MNAEIQKLSKLCFKEKSEEFFKFLKDFDDFGNFKVKYQKLLLKFADKEDFDDFKDYYPEHLFVVFGKYINKTYSIDWSGEEYTGEIKKSLTNILKTYNSPTFKWNHKKFIESLNLKTLKRGDFVSLLFREFDKKLNDLGFQILFIELFDDEYHYTVLPLKEINLGLEINGNEFQTYDSKLYEISITQKPEKKSKLMLYLKNKFSLPLSEIKNFTEKLPIVIERGNILKIKKIKTELIDLDCKYRIEEIEK